MKARELTVAISLRVQPLTGWTQAHTPGGHGALCGRTLAPNVGLHWRHSLIKNPWLSMAASHQQRAWAGGLVTAGMRPQHKAMVNKTRRSIAGRQH